MSNGRRVPGRRKKADKVWMCPVPGCPTHQVRDVKPPICKPHGVSMVKAVARPFAAQRAKIEAERAKEEKKSQQQGDGHPEA